MKIHGTARSSAPGRHRESRIIRSFSRHAGSYDKHARLQADMAEQLACFLPGNLASIPLLEIGCGTGLFTRHLLSRKADRLRLNDISPEMLRRIRLLPTLPTGTKVIRGNAERALFPKSRLIVANAVFQWFENPAKAIANISRSLDDGGELLFSTFGPQTLSELRTIGEIQSPATLLPASEWKRLLKRCGFAVQRAEREIRDLYFPNAMSMIRSLQQIGASPLPLLKINELRMLMREYEKQYKTVRGVKSRWEILYIYCKKSVRPHSTVGHVKTQPDF